MYKLFIALTLLLSQTALAYDFKALAEQYIIPGYQQLAMHTDTLRHTAKTYCESPSATSAAHIQQGYIDAFLAWQSIQHIRFGPIQYLMREHRFQLWPDKRSTVSKHLAQLLNEPETASLNIAKKSVAVQGFSALEQLLFPQPRLETCRVINAISINLHQMANATIADWITGEAPFQQWFTQPNENNPLYATETELAGEILNNLHTQFEILITQKLARPLGKNQKKARSKRAEGWRSGTSITALRRNIQACQTLYQHTFARELGDQPIAQQINDQFTQAIKLTETLRLPLDQAVKNPQERPKLIQLQTKLQQLHQLIKQEMATILNLSLGFNNLDGD
jgi:predicted lipoprotein